jgi:hypothetical protein
MGHGSLKRKYGGTLRDYAWGCLFETEWLQGLIISAFRLSVSCCLGFGAESIREDSPRRRVTL